MKGTANMKTQDLNGRIILNLFFKKYSKTEGVRVVCVMVGTRVGRL